jgi:imidazolonepropionase-like amidohydrolase
MGEGLHVNGLVLPDGVERDVFIEDGRITFDPVADARTITTGAFILPGLVDVHSHLPFNGPAPEGASWDEAARASARVELEAGVLAVRDPGGPTPVGIGPWEGLPRTLTAGRFLAAPDHMFPEHGQRDVTDEELPDAGEEQFRASGSWVKLIGDFPIPGKGFESSFRPDSLVEVAARVHALGGKVAIHAITADTIEAAVAAGFDSIEHGLMIRPDHAAAMAEKGIALVPTMISTPGWLPGVLEQMGIPELEIREVADAVERHPATVREVWETGTPLLAGTDAGIVAHGLVRTEVRLLHEAGVPIDVALGAGSWRARSFLGLPSIEEGAPADLVAYERNPLEDLEVLSSPSVIVLDGNVIRPRADVTER